MLVPELLTPAAVPAPDVLASAGFRALIPLPVVIPGPAFIPPPLFFELPEFVELAAGAPEVELPPAEFCTNASDPVNASASASVTTFTIILRLLCRWNLVGGISAIVILLPAPLLAALAGCLILLAWLLTRILAALLAALVALLILLTALIGLMVRHMSLPGVSTLW